MLQYILKAKKAPKIIKRFSQSQILDNPFCCLLADSLLREPQVEHILRDYQNIYIDVSIFFKNDNKTGIQRVVREIIFQLLLDNNNKSKFKFVAATKSIFYRQLNCSFVNGEIRFEPLTVKSPQVNLNKGDVFIGLDFCPNIVPLHFFTFICAKKKGVRFFWILYDLLPLQYPDWFTENIRQSFEPWLRTILLISDKVLCISKLVEKEARVYAKQLGVHCDLATIKMGYGFREYLSKEISDSVSAIIRREFSQSDFVLMVGTIEPRKGHADIISAFHHLWQNKLSDTRLVIIGKKGWDVDRVLEMIDLSDCQDKIFWLSSVDDELLGLLYQSSLGVVLGSYAEGYGLPLAEAMVYNKYIFARDIDIFKEVADNYQYIEYFKQDNSDLLNKLYDWLKQVIKEPVPQSQSLLDDNISKGWEATFLDIKNKIGLQ